MRTVIFLLLLSFAGSFELLQAQEASLSPVYQKIRTGEFQDAIKLLNKFIIQNPDSINACILLAKVHLGIGGIVERKKAEQALQQGLKRQPQNATMLRMIAGIKETQEMTDQAIRYLKKAIEANPADPALLNQMLENCIREKNADGLKGLATAIEKWITANPDSMNGYISLGKLYLTLGDGKKALNALATAAKLKPDYIPVYKLLSEAYLFSGERALFTEGYYYWLSHEKDNIALQNEYQLAELAMSDQEAMLFKNVSPDKKADYLAKYWRERDPNPITVENERLMEHYRRVYYAKGHYGSAISPTGFDDRGKVYIKWGPPEEKYVDAMPAQGLESGAGLGAIPPPGVEPPMPTPESFPIRGNESWYYPSISYYLAFDFVNSGGYYREVNSLLEAIPGAGAKSNIGMAKIGEGAALYAAWFQMQQLYRDREHLGGLYARLANNTPDQFARDVYSEIPLEKTSAHRTLKPRFEVRLDIPPLDFSIRTIQFRGDSGRTSLEIGYGVELNQLKPKPRQDTTFTFYFNNDLVFFDTSAKRILQRKYQLQKSYPPNYKYEGNSIVSEAICELLPQEYDMAFQMVELSNRMGKFTKNRMSIRDFAGNELLISDLKVSPNADNSKADNRPHVFTYPFSNIRQESPAYLYFEVYNLTMNPEKQTNYEVSLKMEREIRKREFAAEAVRAVGRIFSGGSPKEIETIYQRKGDNQTAMEFIELDLSRLPAGHSRLTVTAKDLNAGKQVENSVEFDLQ